MPKNYVSLIGAIQLKQDFEIARQLQKSWMISKLETRMDQMIEEDCGKCGDCDECDRNSHISSLANLLWRMRNDLNCGWKRGVLCDGSICSMEGTEFFVHSFILSAASSKFYANFRTGGIWKYSLPNYSGIVVQILIDFAYGVEIDEVLCEKHVQEVLSLCSDYSVRGLMSHCESLMLKWLFPDNCVSYYYYAKTYNLQKLENRSRLVILRNFSKVYNSTENLKLLQFEDFMSLLDDDLLNVVAEEELLVAVLRWVNCNHLCRNKHLSNLFSAIRSGLFRHPSIASATLPCPIQQMQENYISNQSSIPTISKHSSPRISPSLVFSIGGWCSGAATNRIEVFNSKASSWTSIDDPYCDIFVRAYHGMALLNGRIYIFGGYDGNHCYRSVRCFDPATAQWSICNSMQEERLYVSVAVVQDIELYALGGFDGLHRKCSCEKFLPSRNQWLPIARMNCVRSDASAATCCFNKKIMICGGFDGERVLASAEEYIVDANQWTMISPLPGPRSGHQLTLCGQFLYLIGGFDGTDRVNTVYRYSNQEERWMTEPPLRHCRSNFAVFILNGCLHVVGGFDGRTLISSMEYLNSENRVCWKYAPSLTLKRSAFSTCVVTDIPNPQRYTAREQCGKQNVSYNVP